MKRQSLSLSPISDIGEKRNFNAVRSGKLGWASRSQESKDKQIKLLMELSQSRCEKREILQELKETGLDTDEYIY